MKHYHFVKKSHTAMGLFISFLAIKSITIKAIFIMGNIAKQFYLIDKMRHLRKKLVQSNKQNTRVSLNEQECTGFALSLCWTPMQRQQYPYLWPQAFLKLMRGLIGQSRGETRHHMGQLDAQEAANRAAVLLVTAKAPDVCVQVSQVK